MVYDGVGERDIRGIDIDKLAKGFGEIAVQFKNFVNKGKTKAREIRWYREGISLATAMNPIDTPTTTGVTKSLIPTGGSGSLPAIAEQKWERQTSYVKKFFVESPMISIEDIKDSDPDVLGRNVKALVKAVVSKVDRRIYDVITEATTTGTPNPTNVNTAAATDGWATVATANPILDILIGQRKITAAGYTWKNGTILMNELEYQSLLNYLISVKGSSIPAIANDAAKKGVIMELLGQNIVVSPNATVDWVIQFSKESATYKSFMPITSVVMSEPGIGKTIRVWEEGEAILTDPLSVNIISSAS